MGTVENRGVSAFLWAYRFPLCGLARKGVRPSSQFIEKGGLLGLVVWALLFSKISSVAMSGILLLLFRTRTYDLFVLGPLDPTDVTPHQDDLLRVH